MRHALLCTVFAVGSLSLGCGGGPSLVPVSGTVTADGKPLSMGGVRFVPDKGKGNTSTLEPVGTISSDGSYTLYTQDKPGAAAGWYKVAVNSAEIGDSAKPESSKSYVAPKFNDPDKSGLLIEVSSGAAAGAYDLKTTAK